MECFPLMGRLSAPITKGNQFMHPMPLPALLKAPIRWFSHLPFSYGCNAGGIPHSRKSSVSDVSSVPTSQLGIQR